MNICYITCDAPSESNMGGLATYIRSLVPEMVKRGHEVHIVCPANHQAKTYLFHGATVHAFRNRYFSWIEHVVLKSPFRRWHPFIRGLHQIIEGIRTFRSVAKHHSFDILEGDEGGGISGFCKPYTQAKLITRLHTSWHTITVVNRMKRGIMAWTWKHLERQQYRKSDLLLANSRAMRTFFHKLHPGIKQKVGVMYCPLRLTISKEKEDGNYILFFGTIEQRKGVFTLWKAIPKVLAKHPDLELWMVGKIENQAKTMPAARAIKRRLGKQIRFLGKKSREEIYSLINGARIVIIPSDWEAFGYVCAESMAHGAVVAASDGSGLEEQIQKDGVNGFLFPPEHPAALAKKLLEVLALPKTALDDVKKNAKEQAAFFQSNDRITEYEHLLQRLT